MFFLRVPVSLASFRALGWSWYLTCGRPVCGVKRRCTTLDAGIAYMNIEDLEATKNMVGVGKQVLDSKRVLYL